MTKNTVLLWGLLYLRLSSGFILMIFGIEKIILAPKYIDIMTNFFAFNSAISMSIGVIEFLLGILLILGIKKSIVYGTVLLLRVVATLILINFLVQDLVNWYQYIFLIPINLSFLALFLMRHIDNKWIIAKKKYIFC